MCAECELHRYKFALRNVKCDNTLIPHALERHIGYAHGTATTAGDMRNVICVDMGLGTWVTMGTRGGLPRDRHGRYWISLRGIDGNR